MGRSCQCMTSTKKLDEIITEQATHGRAGIERILLELFRQMSDIQVKWLVRLILKDMRLSLGQNSVLNELHPDARELFDVNANLRKVCETLRDPTVRMNEIEISLFDPFKPMLAERGSSDFQEAFEKQLRCKEFYIEVKYDGERMQLHKNGDKYRFFSRNGHDFTDDFGASTSQRDKFCSHVSSSVSPRVKTLILDGEICAYNHLTGVVCQKGEQMNIRHLKADDPTYHQCLFVYDILLVNDQVLTNKPLNQRLEILHKVVTEIPGRIHFSERKTGSSSQDISTALFDAIDRREEGIVVKNPNSVYKPNARTGGGWLKIKPEYNNELMDQCDLIVMGGYYGKGRRTGVTHFLMGVVDDSKPVSTIRSFCRVGSGYSMKELFELMQKLSQHFVENKKKASSRLKFGREVPDVWISPDKSVVLQINAAEIVSSDTYDTGCTLRQVVAFLSMSICLLHATKANLNFPQISTS